MKKLIAMLLCLTVFAAVSASASASDLNTEQLAALYEYGIFQGDETGDLHLDQTITRAEFCKVICCVLGYNDTATLEAESAFQDVPPSYWACPYIQRAKSLQLIEGMGDNLFMPDETISNQDVMKIVITALGYEPKAEALGGYPAGYAAVASELGLTLSKELDPCEKAIREDVANLIYEALTIPVMQQTEFGETVVYTVMDGSNGTPYVTLKNQLDPGSNLPTEAEEETEGQTPRFNGPEYTGRVLQIKGLHQKDERYFFQNGLNSDDHSVYVITEDTHISISSNTVGLKEIANDMYAQCWYYTDDSGEIALLKIELMREKPAGI